MSDNNLWNIETERNFFFEALSNFASPEQIFYDLKSGYFAYVPKKTDGEKKTLQSRNSLIGNYTEKWTKDIFNLIAKDLGLFDVNGIVCNQLGLTKQSRADLALCTINSTIQSPENIKLIFEVKMSIVSNYQFTQPKTISLLGDYKSHKGTPSLLRSDSMLKAIGKAINIKVSCVDATIIPIIILGNSPITTHYSHKVDYLKTSGVIQGFWSLNPNPIKSKYIRMTTKLGFQTIENMEKLKKVTKELLSQKSYYFSSMIPKAQLGRFILKANKEKTDIAKAEKFLELIRE